MIFDNKDILINQISNKNNQNLSSENDIKKSENETKVVRK